jgi:arylsulfatase A-like enzyme
MRLVMIGCALVLAVPLANALLRLALLHRNVYVRVAWVSAAALVTLICATELDQNRLEAKTFPNTEQGQKNVLIIVVDALRADHVSLAGYSRLTTPHLDRFAARGANFTEAISVSSWALPAHASLLTGLYPHEHRTQTHEDRLPSDVPVASEWFAQHGYRTAAFSANKSFFSRRNGFGRGFMVFHDVYPPLNSLLLSTMIGQQLAFFAHRTGLSPNLLGRSSAYDINAGVTGWINHDSGPFFAVLNYFDVHDPYIPPPEYRERFTTTNSPLGEIGTTFNSFPDLTDVQRQHEIAMYDSAISYTDDQIDNLLQDLDHRGILRNTVVVITSDHGEEFYEHGFYTHGNALYTELVHVPLIIVAPGEVPPATRISTPVSLTNIPATVIDLATGQTAHDSPQRSLATLWRDPNGVGNWPPPIPNWLLYEPANVSPITRRASVLSPLENGAIYCPAPAARSCSAFLATQPTKLIWQTQLRRKSSTLCDRR